MAKEEPPMYYSDTSSRMLDVISFLYRKLALITQPTAGFGHHCGRYTCVALDCTIEIVFLILLLALVFYSGYLVPSG